MSEIALNIRWNYAYYWRRFYWDEKATNEALFQHPSFLKRLGYWE